MPGRCNGAWMYYCITPHCINRGRLCLCLADCYCGRRKSGQPALSQLATSPASAATTQPPGNALGLKTVCFTRRFCLLGARLGCLAEQHLALGLNVITGLAYCSNHICRCASGGGPGCVRNGVLHGKVSASKTLSQGPRLICGGIGPVLGSNCLVEGGKLVICRPLLARLGVSIRRSAASKGQ